LEFFGIFLEFFEWHKEKKKMFFVLLLFSIGACQLAFEGSRELTDDTIGEAIMSGPVLINFYIPFTGACKEFVEPWNAVARANAGAKLTVAHLNLMRNPISKARFEVRKFPLVVLVHNGEVSRFKFAGTDLQEKSEDVVSAIVAFGKNLGEGEKKQLLPSVPFITPWFTDAKQFVGKDGRIYKGAVF